MAPTGAVKTFLKLGRLEVYLIAIKVWDRPDRATTGRGQAARSSPLNTCAACQVTCSGAGRRVPGRGRRGWSARS